MCKASTKYMNILFLYGVGGGCGGGGGSAESLSGFDGTWIMAKPRQACSLIKVPVLAWSKLRLDLRLLGPAWSLRSAA